MSKCSPYSRSLITRPYDFDRRPRLPVSGSLTMSATMIARSPCGTQRSGQQQRGAQPHQSALPRALLHNLPLAHASWVCTASRKGRKAGGSGNDGSNDGSSGDSEEARRMQDTIRESREQQLTAGKMLGMLVEAEDPAAVAAQHVGSLNEEFFWSADAYLKMAKKEGEEAVVARLEAAMKAAFEAKQATLRPEIQLLNRLLGAGGAEQRAQILGGPEAAEQLLMNDRYFFSLLDRMLGDVRRQPEGSPQRGMLLEQLESVRSEAAQRAEQAAEA